MSIFPTPTGLSDKQSIEILEMMLEDVSGYRLGAIQKRLALHRAIEVLKELK